MTSKHTYLKTHRLSDDMLAFVLPSEVSSLGERAASAKSGRAAKTLVKEGAIRITIIALNKGVTMQAHQVDGAVSIQVLRGRATINAAGSDATMGAGGVAVLAPQQAHVATALTDCALLLTVAMPC